MCEERGIVLIEDCAHTFFGATAAGPVGSLGHYAVASPRKFFPIAEGGLLTSATRDLRELSVPVPSWGRTVQSALRMIDTAVAHGRLRAFAPVLGVAKALRSGLRARPDLQASAGAPGEDADPYKVELDVRQSVGVAGGAGRYLFNIGLIEARRRNFARLSDGIGGAAGARILPMPPLHSFVPYVVPLLLADPQQQFARLKQLGVPMWRWEHSMGGVCKVTDHYSQALIQLPCHQSLRMDDIDRIVRSVASVCK
jgi:dTDP-4-amino-4,6-dideoxygalactose transaminase